MKKLTPILIVDAIEPCLDFWFRLGFETKIEVPHEDALGFVMMECGEIELMLQSRASVAADLPALAAEPARSSLYCEVADLDAARAALGPKVELVVPERRTFYGSREVGVREPGGHLVILSEFGGA